MCCVSRCGSEVAGRPIVVQSLACFTGEAAEKQTFYEEDFKVGEHFSHRLSEVNKTVAEESVAVTCAGRAQLHSGKLRL